MCYNMQSSLNVCVEAVLKDASQENPGFACGLFRCKGKIKWFPPPPNFLKRISALRLAHFISKYMDLPFKNNTKSHLLILQVFTEQILYVKHYSRHWRKSCKYNKNSSINGVYILLAGDNQ